MQKNHDGRDDSCGPAAEKIEERLRGVFVVVVVVVVVIFVVVQVRRRRCRRRRARRFFAKTAPVVLERWPLSSVHFLVRDQFNVAFLVMQKLGMRRKN